MHDPASVIIYQFYNLEHHKNWYLIGEIISLSQTNVLNVFYWLFIIQMPEYIIPQSSTPFKCVIYCGNVKGENGLISTHLEYSLLAQGHFFSWKLLLLYIFLHNKSKTSLLLCFAISPWLFQILPGSSASLDWKTDMNYSRIHKTIHFVFHS